MELKLGQEAKYTKTIKESDVNAYAELVGDYNGVHVNDKIAEQSIFGKKIAHGMLVGGFISAVLGTQLPGEGTIYLEQELKFQKPVYIGDTVTATVVVSEVINEKKGIYKLNTVVSNQNEDIVLDGYAVVKYLNSI